MGSHLHPPSPVRQYLISPPASPPIGWVPKEEAEPIINYDLLSAITKLTPGQSHELHPSLDEKPSIVIHVCEDTDVQSNNQSFATKVKIQQTKRPPVRFSSEGSDDSID